MEEGKVKRFSCKEVVKKIKQERKNKKIEIKTPPWRRKRQQQPKFRQSSKKQQKREQEPVVIQHLCKAIISICRVAEQTSMPSFRKFNENRPRDLIKHHHSALGSHGHILFTVENQYRVCNIGSTVVDGSHVTENCFSNTLILN
jgi:hypothetical protein